jgi:ATP-dependent DNA helicase RecQ
MLSLLQKHFGYGEFRPLQKEIIDWCLAKHDALVLMPTGGGKSLCFQLPALAFPGITIVVSPLIALMKDQVDALRENGIPAAFINSSLVPGEAARIERMAMRDEIKLLYLAPERIAIPRVQEFLNKLRVSLFAIDEAHCISEWGHDFRPEYRNLKMLRKMFPDTPLMALTATANVRVRKDIIAQLGLQRGRVFQSSFNRPNLTYRVEPKKKSFEILLAEVRARPNQAVIAYCFSRKNTEKIAADLRANGVNALAYHAGLSNDERTRVQNQFIRDQVPVIVATIAFGMGIDKPDVRLVVHMDLPKSIEGYYQETGRAGRDGLPSDCLLLYSAGDRFKQEFFIRELSDSNEQARARKQLDEITRYCEQRTCRRAALLTYFGESWEDENCGGCDICLPPRRAPELQRVGTRALGTNPRALGTNPRAQAVEAYDDELFEKLRLVRRALADANGVPPYVIFGDRTLQEMSRAYPQRMETMARIFGVGREKLARYGEAFLTEIRAHASERNIPDAGGDVRYEPDPPVRRAASDTIRATLELLKEKRKLGEIALLRKISLGTVLQHLEKARELGLEIETSHLSFPSRERFDRIAEALKSTGGTMLAPAKSILGEEYTYDEIRYVRFLTRAAED